MNVAPSDAVDLPAWINAVTVVLLALITTWYAFTTSKMLAELRAERADRLAGIRAPFQNVVVFTEDLIAKSRRLHGLANAIDDDNLTPWDALRDDVRDRAIDAEPRSRRLSRALYNLHTHLQHVERAQQSVRDALNRNDTAGAAAARTALDAHLVRIGTALEPARAEVGRYV